MSIRLKRHPRHRELKAYLDTLPPAARARWWRNNRGWVDAGKPGPPPEPPRRPWTAEKVAEQAAAVRKYRAESDVTRQDEIEWHARLLNLKAVEGGGKKDVGMSGDGERDDGRPPLKLMPTPASPEIPKPRFQPEPSAPAPALNEAGAGVDVVRALVFAAPSIFRGRIASAKRFCSQWRFVRRRGGRGGGRRRRAYSAISRDGRRAGTRNERAARTPQAQVSSRAANNRFGQEEEAVAEAYCEADFSRQGRGHAGGAAVVAGDEMADRFRARRAR